MARRSAALMLVLSIAIYWLAVARADVLSTRLPDMFPGPDAGEYLSGAVSLYETGEFTLHIAGDFYPSRYPFGYSLVMVPLLGIGLDPLAVPFRTNHILGLMLLIVMFLALFRRRHYWEAGIAVVLLSTLPMFLILARSSMSDISSGIIVFCAYWLLYETMVTERNGAGYVGALLLGISLWFRVSNIFFVLILVLTPFWTHRKMKQILRQLCLIGLSFVMGALPLYIYQYKVFGGPFKTGYGYWIPKWAKVANAFGIKYLESSVNYFVQEALQLEGVKTIASMYGEGSYYGPAQVLLALVGARYMLISVRKPLFPFALSGILAALPYAFYFVQDGRFLFPVFLIATPLVARGLVDLCATRRNWLVITSVAFIACHFMMFPGYRKIMDLPLYLQMTRIKGQAVLPQVLRAFEEVRDAQKSTIVFTDIQVPFLYAITRGPRIVAPLKDRHRYRHNQAVFKYGSSERQRQIKEAIDRGWQVCAASVAVPAEEMMKMLPHIKGWQWETLWMNNRSAALLSLNPKSLTDEAIHLP